MKDFDSLLAEAAARYAQSACPAVCQADEAHDYSEAARERLRSILTNESERRNERMTKRISKKMTAVLIAAAVLLAAGVVCAATPAIREYLNLKFLREDSMGPLTEVPDGWIGVYTAEDLDHVRNDLHGKYILMNDIVLTEDDYTEGGIFEGGFEPIGDGETPFYGTFNGNGHIISGLCVTYSKISFFGRSLHSGLFGCVKRYHDFEQEFIYEQADMDMNGDGVIDGNDRKPVGVENANRDITGGLIKNLGLTDGMVVVTCDEYSWAEVKGITVPEYPDRFAVGAVAGWADYVVGCWTEDFTVSFTAKDPVSFLNLTENWLDVGGVVGGCSMMDSCRSNAEVIAAVKTDIPENIYIAGLAGMADSCVTSYFDGSVECGSLPGGGAVNLRVETVPIVLTETMLEDIMNRIDAVSNDDNIQTLEDGTTHTFNACKVAAFYCSTDYIAYDFTMQDFMTSESEEKLMLLDPETKSREYHVLTEILDMAFPDGDFREYCIENNIKFDSYYTYDLRTEPDCAFEGFDFDSIWTWDEENRPVLRLFEEARKADAARPRLGWQKGLFQANLP